MKHVNMNTYPSVPLGPCLHDCRTGHCSQRPQGTPGSPKCAQEPSSGQEPVSAEAGVPGQSLFPSPQTAAPPRSWKMLPPCSAQKCSGASSASGPPFWGSVCGACGAEDPSLSPSPLPVSGFNPTCLRTDSFFNQHKMAFKQCLDLGK